MGIYTIQYTLFNIDLFSVFCFELYALSLGFFFSLKYKHCLLRKPAQEICQFFYFLATEEVDIEKKKRREDDSPKEKIPYPYQIFYIISMEACERFSYYGMNGKEFKFQI